MGVFQTIISSNWGLKCAWYTLEEVLPQLIWTADMIVSENYTEYVNQ